MRDQPRLRGRAPDPVPRPLGMAEARPVDRDDPVAVVVGHSWGTIVALALAITEGLDLRGLVLLSGYY
jgi:pimeloyl-ACP methyl ester carboxylesterase